ncbi:MAG: hypothetical protein LCH30_02670 [Proteobacteria bacterium]|nr:hypothetical protein [Pseudomonadota bacterium]
MKKIIISALLLFFPLFFTGCTVTQSNYVPAYRNDYVYSVGYYGYRPYWNNSVGYGWGVGNYWGGNRSFYNRGWGWGGRGWRGHGWGGRGWGHHR